MHLLKRAAKAVVFTPRVSRGLSRGLLRLDNALDRLINTFAVLAEDGVHPKHRLMKYHDFFVEQIKPTDTVLDVGCGNGAVAHSLASKAKRVAGIDLNPGNIAYARARFASDNLTFVCGDALTWKFPERFDAVVLSNVLEHIEDRASFFRRLAGITERVLIRVPLLERDWKVLWKKELGVPYLSDATHFVEHTERQFREELERAGYAIQSLVIRYGEIWAVTRPAPAGKP